MTKKAEPTLRFEKVAEWDAWLAKHHARSSAVLLRISNTPRANGR